MALSPPRGFMPILPRHQSLIVASTALVPPLIPPLSHDPRVQHRRRGKPKGKNKPMTSSERGIKFRQRQQEKQDTLLAENQTLWQQVQQLRALRDMSTQKSLSTPCSAAGTSPMSFVMEYFNQFRSGLTSEKQKDFLDALVEPHAMFGGKPAADLILSVWDRYSKFHSSVKLSCESVELITADNCSTVAVCGTLHLRYSRRTIENVYPHAAAEEELIQKLIGRQLHVRYQAQMHFNESGRLVAYEMSPDFVGAMMEILGSLKDCERILGRALIKGHVLGEEPEPEVEGKNPVEMLSEVESENPQSEIEIPRSSSQAMKLDYILS
ncbi:Hypothetical protein PHPALM_15097 [Phytophthora palmivora]|uniref:Bzip transcription factor n=1 Tax=Phytophthora palmivora TaxID=4796 RepID=A0A2P4XT30_9STRA|nr:Hypothetical protein PHPALM_15097 [Phytophthora palmivora]